MDNPIHDITSKVTKYCEYSLVFSNADTMKSNIRRFIKRNYNKNFSISVEMSRFIENAIHLHIDFGYDNHFHILIAQGNTNE